jgi:hypothetical protein
MSRPLAVLLGFHYSCRISAHLDLLINPNAERLDRVGMNNTITKSYTYKTDIIRLSKFYYQVIITKYHADDADCGYPVLTWKFRTNTQLGAERASKKIVRDEQTVSRYYAEQIQMADDSTGEV